MGKGKIRFDGWVLDPESGDLERSGTRLRLQEQPVMLLRELVAHAGRVVTREQLIALLWPKGVVDFDTGLNTAVRKLRSALGDTAETPRYIETLPRRGYRFIGSLDTDPGELPAAAAPADQEEPGDVPAPVPVPEAPPSAAAADSGPVAERGPSASAPVREGGGQSTARSEGSGGLRRSPWLVVAGAAALIAAGVTWFAFSRGAAWRDPLSSARVARLTDWPGTEQAAAISRDGNSVAFLADHTGATDVWVTQLGSGDYRNLTEGKMPGLLNPSIRSPGFSPDGSLVTMWTRVSDGSRTEDVNIMAVPVGGGPLRLYLPEGAEVAWSSDGRRIVYHTSATGDPLFVGELPPGQARMLYVAPVGVHCHFPLWSPDDSFIYFVRGVPPDRWDVWRIRPAGTDLEQITHHNSRVSHPVLLDRRTLLYLASDAQGVGPWMYAMDLEKREPHRIGFGLERYTSLASSANGARLVATTARSSSSLWHATLGPAVAGPASATRVAGAESGVAPRTGTDFLLYVSSQAGRPAIWKLSGGRSRELWSGEPASLVGPPAIAPDGRRIAFTVTSRERSRLYIMDSDGAHPHSVGEPLAMRGSLAWSPDGRSIVVAVLYEGEPRLTRLSLEGAAPYTLVNEYSVDPVWAPGGRFLLYSGADVGMTFPLRAVGPEGRPYPLRTLVLTRGARRVVFRGNDHEIVILRGEIVHKNFWAVDLLSGAERQLTELGADFDVRDFDVSADGSELVFDRSAESSTIALIERGH
ncbi:MAG TPA: winged helix-turn-helix domain-containing protein [Steroidobacteraceae bacterium]|nr:winged helix-turn-helix domain-containing protein [Steroidobacteraceae bacterium]